MTELFSLPSQPDPLIVRGVAPALIAVVRHEAVTLADLPRVFDGAYEAVARALTSVGAAPSGPAVASYTGDPNGTFALEIGFPVTAAPSDFPGELIASTTPGGELAIMSHLGPYEDLPASWDRLVASILALGRTPGPHYGEVYRSMPGPGSDAAMQRTDLFIDLA